MKKCLFLDRDGVINFDNGYTYKVEDLEFITGIFDLCKLALSMNYIIIIITNQAGIGKGYYKETDFWEFMKKIDTEFKKNDILITKVYFCPYHVESVIKNYKINSFYRKPNPGMILKAQQDFKIDLKNSVLIGDNKTDIIAGENAGIKTNILFEKSFHNLDFYRKIFSSL